MDPEEKPHSEEKPQPQKFPLSFSAGLVFLIAIAVFGLLFLVISQRTGTKPTATPAPTATSGAYVNPFAQQATGAGYQNPFATGAPGYQNPFRQFLR